MAAASAAGSAVTPAYSALTDSGAGAEAAITLSNSALAGKDDDIDSMASRTAVSVLPAKLPTAGRAPVPPPAR